MSDKKSVSSYFVLFLFLNIIFVVISVYLANFIFIKWQKIPMDFFSYKTLYLYHLKYGSHEKIAFAIKACMGVGALVVAIFNIVVLSALFVKPKRELHGSARFANDMEIKKAGFIISPKEREKKLAKKPTNPPILIGKYKGKFLEFWGNEFVYVAAPTRSGKGVGIVIPNLLNYPDSCIVLDVKNENYDLTAGFRSKYQEVFLFAPKAADGRSHRYNPLDYIDRNPINRMADIQNIANILYPTDSGLDGNTIYFNGQAQRLFTGFVLYMLETPARPCSMAELIKLSTPTIPLNDWIIAAIQNRKTEEIIINVETGEKAIQPLTVECVEALMSYAGNDSENTRSGISSSMAAPLVIFTDPMVAAATSASDFRLDEVRKKRMTIYVGIQPNELPRFDKLLNLMFSQLINLNTRVLPEQDPSLKYQCLVLLDEFTALGRVEIINKAVAYIAGYNLRLMLIFQNKAQAEQHYGKEGAQTLLSNMAVQVVYTPQTIDDADFYSKILGTETVKGRSISRNRGKGGGGSTSISDQSRALMLPQELMEYPNEKELIKFRGLKAIECEKIVFHEDEVFQKRLSEELDAAGRRKGLPIPEKTIPPKLDVEHMLEVMRGTSFKKVESVEEFTKHFTAQNLIKNHSSYIQQISNALGFDADFLDLDDFQPEF